jgi:hypothetical protein
MCEIFSLIVYLAFVACSHITPGPTFYYRERYCLAHRFRLVTVICIQATQNPRSIVYAQLERAGRVARRSHGYVRLTYLYIERINVIRRVQH